MILLRETFRHRRVFTWVPLHLYTEMFLHRCFYMLIHLQYTVLYAHILLRWDSFTLKHFYTEALWHTVAGTFTCKYFYTAVFILRAFSLHTRMLCHRDAFDHTCFYTDIFTRRHLCTERNAFVHTNTFTERWSYIDQFDSDTKTKKGFFTKECMCTKGF